MKSILEQLECIKDQLCGDHPQFVILLSTTKAISLGIEGNKIRMSLGIAKVT